MYLKKILSIGIFLTLINLNINAEKKQNFVKIGGALRFNTIVENYENSRPQSDAAIKLDTWFLSADAHQQGFDLSLQYRFYPDIKNHFLHHAYLGYAFNEQFYAKFGVFQRPFGIGDFASHSWWFQIPYYLGLEDGNGTGIGAVYKNNKLTIDAAYFRQAAPKGFMADNSADNAVGNGRYAYAIVSTTGFSDGNLLDASIRELNQFNARVRYNILPSLELGASAQLGGIQNTALNKTDWGLNWAAHLLHSSERWSFKGEIIGYDYNASADDGSKLDILQMAAYGSAYDVASKGLIYVAGLAYTIPVNKKLLSSIQTYVDYSMVSKSNKAYHDSHHLIPGILLRSGPIYTHIDYAIGKNQPWLTSFFGEGLGMGQADARWNARLNINIGYYF